MVVIVKRLFRVALRHDAERLHSALGLSWNQYDEVVREVAKIFDEEDKYTEAIEKVLKRYNDSRLLAALLIIGGLIAADMIFGREEDEEVTYIG
ncbi:MAG: hypothetical protein ABDH32_05320 [Candidatus Caldarchaeales archaeon]